MGTFQFKHLQGGDLSKADKNFGPVSVRFREVPLYLKVAERTKITNGRFTHKTLLVKDLEISVFVEKEFNVRCCIKGYHLEPNELKDIGNLAAFKKTIKK